MMLEVPKKSSATTKIGHVNNGSGPPLPPGGVPPPPGLPLPPAARPPPPPPPKLGASKNGLSAEGLCFHLPY